MCFLIIICLQSIVMVCVMLFAKEGLPGPVSAGAVPSSPKFRGNPHGRSDGLHKIVMTVSVLSGP